MPETELHRALQQKKPDEVRGSGLRHKARRSLQRSAPAPSMPPTNASKIAIFSHQHTQELDMLGVCCNDWLCFHKVGTRAHWKACERATTLRAASL